MLAANEPVDGVSMTLRSLTNPGPAAMAHDRPSCWQGALNRAPGLALTGALAAFAIEFSKLGWLQANGISALTLAIVLGMLVGNTVYPRLASASAGGVTFSKQTLLRAGIILYGLRLTFQDIANVGISGVTIDIVVLSSTFVLSWWVGTQIFGLDRRTAMLIGAGSSICGAAAVMATEPVVRGRAEQVTVAVSTVVVFGTLDIFLYPAMYHLNAHYHLLAMSPTAYGIYAGSTIHEVAQVVAAGGAITDAAANTAVITKMVRVMMLAPFLIILSTYLSRTPNGGGDDGMVFGEAACDEVREEKDDGGEDAHRSGSEGNCGPSSGGCLLRGLAADGLTDTNCSCCGDGEGHHEGKAGAVEGDLVTGEGQAAHDTDEEGDHAEDGDLDEDLTAGGCSEKSETADASGFEVPRHAAETVAVATLNAPERDDHEESEIAAGDRSREACSGDAERWDF